jgi:type I restriction enzyme S subunit
MQARITEYVGTMQKTEGEEAFQETEIGSIPADWKVMRLGDCLALIRNGLTKRQNKDGIGVPVTRIETIAEDKIDPNKVGYVANISQEEIDKFRLKEGDILLSHINSEPQLGRSVVYTGYPPMLLHGMNLLLMRTWIDRLSPYFLNFLFAHYRQRGVFIGIASRAVGQSSINQGKMKSLKIPLPSLPEQQRTAKVLGTIQRAIEQQDKIIEAAKNLKKSLMQKLFIEGLGHTEFKETEIGQIPANWGVVRLGDVGIFQYGYTTSAIEDRTGVKFLRITDIQGEGNIIWENVPYCKLLENELEKYRLAEGDILFARIGATTGKTCIIESPPISTFGSYLIRLQIKEKSKFSPKFIYYFMNTANYWTWINANKEGKLKKGISASFLKTLPIPLPPLDEQQEVARILSTVDKKIEVEEKRKATFNELFKTMLHRLMTGEIRLKDVEV